MGKFSQPILKSSLVDDFTLQDVFFMKRALKLAERGRGKTSPNPMVGAVLVKNNKILAEGYHRGVGMAHAEVDALQNLTKGLIKGSILYVTLEPCNHFGRTPPCTDFLIRKGVKDIVVAMRDHNPLVSGQGILKLQKAGVKVRVGILEEEAKKLNEVFLFSIVEKRSFVIVKSAFTLDGKIATENGDSKWISNEKSRAFVHQMRGQVDAILTSSATVLADDPHLGVRMAKGRDPLRVIIDSRLRTALKAQVYRDKKVLVATSTEAPSKKLKAFEKAGISLLIYRSARVPLRKLLEDLYARGVGCVMVEAGGGLLTSLFKEKLVQKVYFFIAPKIIGSGIGFVQNLGIQKISKAIIFEKTEVKRFDDDIMMVGNCTF